MEDNQMHDVTVEYLIEENNRLREELNDENKVYMRKYSSIYALNQSLKMIWRLSHSYWVY